VITVVLRVAIFWIPLAFSVHRNSFTWDEDEHIYSGYMSWQHGDFGLNPEHPPLMKLIAALPLLHLPAKMPSLQNRFFKLEGLLGILSQQRRGGNVVSGAWRRRSVLCCWRY